MPGMWSANYTGENEAVINTLTGEGSNAVG